MDLHASPSLQAATGLTYLTEDDVRRTLPPGALFEMVGGLVLRHELESPFAAEASLTNISLAAKAGVVDSQGFGLKIRAGAEGRYLTVAWPVADGDAYAVVESSYLTYFRTAALLLLLPWKRHLRVARILVLGTGRLGSAAILLARTLYPDSEVSSWSPSGRLPSDHWGLGTTLDVTVWQPPNGKGERFDLVLSCVPSCDPSLLEPVTPTYVGVGGAVNRGRTSLPAHWVRDSSLCCADAPTHARERCGDVRALGLSPLVPLVDALRIKPSPRPGPVITFVCGTGGIDVALALRLRQLRQQRGAEL